MSGLLMGLVYYYDYPHDQREVLLCLADHANDDGEHVRPGVDTLCWKLKADRRNVQRILRELEQIGVLVKVGDGGGAGRTTEYEIDILAGPLKATPPKGRKMRKIWEMLKGGAGTAVLSEADEKGGAGTADFDDAPEKGGAGTADFDEKGGTATADSQFMQKQRYSTHKNSGNPRKNSGNPRKNSGTGTARISIETSEETEEETSRTRTSKKQRERETPEHPAAFRRDYRLRHGVGSTYSAMDRAYIDAYGLTMDEAHRRYYAAREA